MPLLLMLKRFLGVLLLLYFLYKRRRPKQIQHKRHVVLATRNTLFWNPSQDPQNPNFAFKESCMTFLIRLLQMHHVTLIQLVHSDQEQLQIQGLLEPLLPDKSRLLYCSTHVSAFRTRYFF